MNPVLKVRDVCLSYHTLSGETPALSHISFDLMPGEFLSIVGPSGCGKSTLLNLIAGLLTPEHGSITLGPELLLLDEPFSALDYQTRLNVSDDIGKILKSSGKPAILVTHDISEAISMADRVLILSARPATVQKIIDIDLDIRDRTPLSSRNAPDFKKYFNIIWKELNENA